MPFPADIDATIAQLNTAGYIAPRPLATALFLSLSMGRPLLMEGEAGVGKTALALAVADMLDCRLIRLQCYEGLDANTALYEWDYPRQLLALRRAEASGQAEQVALYDESYLIKRPLLRALQDDRVVLLIDELDRADEPFDAFLLEFLADFAVTIPELGTVRAATPPPVFITSNRTREIHDAIKRRCLYHWLDFPDAERETAILQQTHPELATALSGQIIAFVQQLRQLDLFKIPGIAETLDWAQALQRLQIESLDGGGINDTLGALLKYQDDLAHVRDHHPPTSHRHE